MGKEVGPTREGPIVLDDVVRAQIPQVDPVPPVGEPEGRIGDGFGGGGREVIGVHDGVSKLAIGDAFAVAGEDAVVRHGVEANRRLVWVWGYDGGIHTLGMESVSRFRRGRRREARSLRVLVCRLGSPFLGVGAGGGCSTSRVTSVWRVPP